jgi:hypothetical protein
VLASAADPRGAAKDAVQLDAAYFPPICAVSALLDSLADYHSDTGTSNHSFIAHYRDSAHAAERLVAITADAAERVKHLRHSRRHAIILAGITSYYLSSPSARAGFPAPVADAVIRSVGSLATPMRAAMRARRYMHAASHRLYS